MSSEIVVKDRTRTLPPSRIDVARTKRARSSAAILPEPGNEARRRSYVDCRRTEACGTALETADRSFATVAPLLCAFADAGPSATAWRLLQGRFPRARIPAP